MNMTLSDLTHRSGLSVFDYLDQSISIPVIDGMQAQGDLLVIPYHLVAGDVRSVNHTQRVDVPLSGVELLRSAAGGNPHTLVADGGRCRWSSPVRDEALLALGILENDVVAYLIHPEHGATGIAPGRYVIRRQRERGTGGLFGQVHFIAD